MLLPSNAIQIKAQERMNQYKENAISTTWLLWCMYVSIWMGIVSIWDFILQYCFSILENNCFINTMYPHTQKTNNRWKQLPTAGLYFLNSNTFYRKIPQYRSIAMKFDRKLAINATEAPVNFQSDTIILHTRISQLRDFVRSGGKTFNHLVNRDRGMQW